MTGKHAKKVLVPAGRAPDAATGEKLFDTFGHNATQRTRAGLEALLVGPDIVVEVLLEHLIKNSGFRMARAISSRGIADPNIPIRRGERGILNTDVLGES